MNWTIESIVAMTLVPLIMLGLLAAGLLLIRAGRHDSYDGPLWTGLGVTSLAGVVLAGGLLWWGMYPWKAEYHSWQQVSGTVASVDSRLLPGGDGSSVEQKFVVTFTDHPGQLYGVLDTRAAAVRPGDQLDISCVRRWQQTGSHGYDCLFTSYTAGGAA